MKTSAFFIIRAVTEEKLNKKELLLGNEAIARGLFENGCLVATSYPGTPASEILTHMAKLKTQQKLKAHVQWAINEKVAFEIAYAGAISGLRACVAMKQVGLNVASDPLMSAAYMGVKGGFIVISADDPGPHSSQTEQDSRLMAMMAKIPVLDPDSPEMAGELIKNAYEISEKFQIPVMVRPTTRICHSRQDILLKNIPEGDKKPEFEKNPPRWAATPKFRFKLHKELEAKLEKIASYEKTKPEFINPHAKGKKLIVASGVAAAHVKEILDDLGLMDSLPFCRVIQPYPLHPGFMSMVSEKFEKILVIEETMPVIEMQLADKNKVSGKMNNVVSAVGELTPEKIEKIIAGFSGIKFQEKTLPHAAGTRPTLCAGCPHRAAFFAIKKAAKKGIYTSDIGCYTLGLNLGAVDTVLCMGAAISQASGFYQAYKDEEKPPDIVATMGDSTFFHSGIPALIDAVVQNIGFVLVILDNRTTAMTGNQPTPATGLGAANEPLKSVNIESIVKGCGIGFCKTGDPYDFENFKELVKKAVDYSRKKGPAVVISRHPCLLDRLYKTDGLKKEIIINEKCDGCGYCVDQFECPALVFDNEKEVVNIDAGLCTGCGVCISVCPKGSIEEKNE